MAGLDFRNPVRRETFGGTMLERNTNESSGANLKPKDVQSPNSKKTVRSNYKVQGQDNEESDQETSALAVREPSPKPWNPSSNLKFPCSMMGHKHEVRKCKEFFDMSPTDRWEKLEKGRMCFSCLEPTEACKLKICVNHFKVPKALKCTQCASWEE